MLQVTSKHFLCLISHLFLPIFVGKAIRIQCQTGFVLLNKRVKKL